MTYSAVATFDAAWRANRFASSHVARGALRIVRNSFILGVGAIGFVGVAAAAVTFVAAWMAGGTMQPHVRLPTGPGSLVLAPHDPAAARGQCGGAQWAGAFVDRSRPILPAEKARPMIAEPAVVPVSPAARIPMPRPMPARLAQTRAEIASPQPVAVAKAPAMPAPKPEVIAQLEAFSKLDNMAKVDPRIDARPEALNDLKMAPKPAPVATIPASLPVSLPPTMPASVARTAVYDITGSVVYMPDGSKLEAHSGYGENKNDPSRIKVRMRGPTPPNVYVLTERERLFHGVRAIRLNPVYKDKMFGRDGMLAHSYLLGPNGQSHGCVSFKDYNKFLTAFLDGKVDKLVVVPDLGGASWKTAALQAEGIPASERRYAGGYSRPTIVPPGGGREERAVTYTSALGFAADRGAGTW